MLRSNGKTCVTADQREIILWDVASGKLRYRFAAQHKAPITYVQYTPQSRLVCNHLHNSFCVLYRRDKKRVTVPHRGSTQKTGKIGKDQRRANARE